MAISKSHLLTLVIFLSVLSVSTILTGQSSETVTSPKPYVVIGEKGNGTTVKISPAQTVLINLPSQPGTGYRWEVIRTDQSDWKLFRLDPKEVEELSNRGILDRKERGGMPGTVEMQVFQLKPLSKKELQVSLQYVRPWARENPAHKFTVNIRLTEGSSSVLYLPSYLVSLTAK